MLLIGGDSSLGAAISARASVQGWSVLSTSRKCEQGSSAESGELFLDLSKQDSIEGFFSVIGEKRFQSVIFSIGKTSKKQEDLDEYFRVHLVNALRVITRVAGLVSHERGSSIIYLSSRAALYPSFDVNYSVVKAGLMAGLRSLSRVAPPNQRFLSLAPGLIEDSSMYREMSPAVQENHRLRAGGSLLTMEEFANQCLEIVNNSEDFAQGATIELGPVY